MSTDAQLTAERDRLNAEMKRLQARYRKLNDRHTAIVDELRIRARKATLEPLLGKPEAVKVKFRTADGKAAKLNDALGTITAIRRSRATVEYAEHGSWDIPLDDLVPAEAQQGLTVTFGGQS